MRRLIFILMILLLAGSAFAADKLQIMESGKIKLEYLPTTDFSYETDPTNATSGQMWFNNATNQIKVRNGSLVYFWNATGSIEYDDGSSNSSGDFLDDFATDSLAHYVQLNADLDIVYDSENQRMKTELGDGIGGIYYETPISGAYYVQATIFGTAAQSVNFGLIANCNGDGSSSSGYVFIPGESSVVVYKFSGGYSVATRAYVNEINYSGGKTWATSSARDMRVEVDGDDMTVKIDFNGDGDFADTDETVTTVTDASYSGGYGGFGAYTALSWVDNFGMGGL